MSATVDVIVPCYNYGRYLPACVDSVLQQAGVRTRVLIIDDASTDGSELVARRLAASDPRIELVVHRTNRGHIATYNEGLDWARATYLLVLSADDLLAPGALARAAALMDAHPNVGFVHGRAIRFSEDDAASVSLFAPAERAEAVCGGMDFIRGICERPINPVETATAVVRTTIQRAAGGYRPQFPHAGDLEMWLRLATRGDVGLVQATQALVRFHSGNMRDRYVGAGDLRQRAEVLRHVFRSERSRIPDADRLCRRALARLASEALSGAEHAFDHDEPYRAPLRLANEIAPGAALTRPYLKLTAKRLLRGVGLQPPARRAEPPVLSSAAASAEDSPPQLSLIMSTRDRARFLPPCLESLEAIRSRHDWELVIVDNASKDNTWSLLQGFVRSTHLRVKLLKEPRPGLSNARNAGVRAAGGELLCFTDDDCYPRPDFVDAVAQVFAENDVGFIGGQILLHDPTDAPVSITTRTDRQLFPAGRFISTGEIQGACMAFRRAVFEQVGLFDTAFGAGGTLKGAEDCEMAARACFAGWNGGFFTEPVIYHHHRRREDGAARITWSYDYSRGAFFAKLLLRHARFRGMVLKSWYWDSPALFRPNRRNLLKFWRELKGAGRYILGPAFRATTPRI